MKYCPICQTRYDEEVMHFCIKDGTPLVEETQPNFTEMPSEGLRSDTDTENYDEETVIRRPVRPSEDNFQETVRRENERLVVPITDRRAEPSTTVRTYQQNRQATTTKKPNTALIVITTMLGTILLIGAGFVIYNLLSSPAREIKVDTNVMTNANQDLNLNTNLSIDNSLFNPNANFNSNLNANFNTNINANLATPSPTKTPTPTPTKTPTPTPSPSPDEDNRANTNANNLNANVRVNTSPSATPSPRATPSVPPVNKPVNVGNMNSRAVSVVKPVYPSAARTLRANGQVVVQIVVDENGKVVDSNAVSGHPLLRQPAEQAARSTRFNPHTVSGQRVKATGTMVYNFVDNQL